MPKSMSVDCSSDSFEERTDAIAAAVCVLAAGIVLLLQGIPGFSRDCDELLKHPESA